MPLEEWGRKRAGELATFYNLQTSTLPLCYPVEPTELAAGMDFSQAPQLLCSEHERLVVYTENGQVFGMAHVAECLPRGSDECLGLIRFMAYEPSRIDVGQAVLRRCEEALAERGHRRLIAFPIEHGYRCYHAGRGFLVDRWTHVLGLLRTNGYEYDEGQMMLRLDELPDAEPHMPDMVAGAHITVSERPGNAAGLRVELTRAGMELGRCTSRPLSAHHGAEAARVVFMVEGLHVAEDLRRRGWGRYLLQRMHSEMRRRGYQKSLIGTDRDNGVALLLYGSTGYRVVCGEWTFTKDL